jgi:hypothetical protein
MLEELLVKLNVAAVASTLFQTFQSQVHSKARARVTLVISLVLSVLLLISTGAALALDGIDLSEPSEEVADGDCSRLVQIKYPFLSCSDGEIGMAEADEVWEDHRQIPLMRPFVEGDGFWGPDLNQM